MGPRERNKASLYKKLEKLRSATHSTAVNKASIVVDASRYIEELKERVEKLNQDVETLESASSCSNQTSLPAQVKVETLEKGFIINVCSEQNCPGLFMSILEAFEGLNLDVLDAKLSCSDNFHLEAVGENEGTADSMDAEVVKQAVVQAIRNWSHVED